MIVAYHSWTSSYHVVKAVDVDNNTIEVVNGIGTEYDGGLAGASGCAWPF